jgi:hypothetical protein
LTRSEEAIDPKSSTTQKSQEDVVLSVSDLDSPENNLSFLEISPNQHYVAFGFDDKGPHCVSIVLYFNSKFISN